MAKKKILLFGGSFNPIHNGHIITARYVKEQLGFDYVHLIPNGTPPHKDEHVSKIDRLQMCNLAANGDPDFIVDDYEIRKDSPSYTIETVEYALGWLRLDKYDSTAYLLVGWDAFVELHTWHRADELVDMCHFVIMCSDKNELKPNKAIYSKVKKFTLMFPPQINIRSTLIRERIKKGLSIRGMVPDQIEHYISISRLYQ